MAEKKSGRGRADTGEPEYTTFRLFAVDGADLSDLARLCGLSIAELYREVCAPSCGRGE